MKDDPIQAARHAMEHDAFARYLGTEVVEIRPGYARTRLQLTENLLNFVKIPHGAVVFAVADQAFAAASNSRGQVAVALNVNITFLAAAKPGATLIAEANEVALTSRTGLYQIEIQDDQGNKIATFQGLAYRKQTQLADLI